MGNDNHKQITAKEIALMCDRVDNKIQEIMGTKLTERRPLISQLGDAVMDLDWATNSRSRAANERKSETVKRGNAALLSFGA